MKQLSLYLQKRNTPVNSGVNASINLPVCGIFRCLFLFFLSFFLFYPQITFADYPMPRYNLQRTASLPFALADIAPLKWTSSNISNVKAPPVVSKEGDIYISTTYGLTKLNKNGEKAWIINNISPQTSPALDDSGNIYFATNDCSPHIYSYDPSGQERWKFNLRVFGGYGCGQNGVPGAVTLSSTEDTLYAGVNYPAQILLALDLQGNIKWHRELKYQYPMRSSPAISSDGTIYIGTRPEAKLFALTPSGKIKWYKAVVTGYTVDLQTPVLDEEGNVYIASYSASKGDILASYDPSGNRRWFYNSSYVLETDLALYQNQIYLAEKTTLKAFHKDNGSLLWSFESPNGVNLRSPIVDKNGVIYTAAGDKLFSISSDGFLKSTFTLGSLLGQPVIADNGLMYVYQNIQGSWNGYLHALGTAPAKALYPVIFIPGIGGSELETAQEIFWSQDNGHGGIFSHAYKAGEKVWVNAWEAAKPGDDDYFDILRLKSDGETAEASLVLNKNLTEFGYQDIDPFFESLGYKKGVNFFIFTYDWRMDIKNTEESLDYLINLAKTVSGQPKVNIVAHSMGGLVGRNYIADEEKAQNVSKLISLGVPHLGSVEALKAVMYGKPLGRQILGDFYLGVSATQVKDIFQNLISAFQLLPSETYFQFYQTPQNYPFFDERDIDNNLETGALNFHQIKSLLTNLFYNIRLFDIANQFHNQLDPIFRNNNNVTLYHIAGSGQPTLGQIKEGWWINWPFKIIPRYEEIYINGDNTVPLYSASLKNEINDLSANAKIYYVEQKHSDLVAKDQIGMQTVKAILEEGDLPINVKNEKISLEGQQLSVDQDTAIDLYDKEGRHTGFIENSEVEINIPGTFFDTLENTTHIFIKKDSPKVTVKLTSTKKEPTNLTIRSYSDDQVIKTAVYKNITLPDTPVEFTLDPVSDTSPLLPIGGIDFLPTTEVTGNYALDQKAPLTSISINGSENNLGSYLPPVTISLTSSDNNSGVLDIYYSLDNGLTVEVYKNPIILTAPGNYTLQAYATDKAGNDEKLQVFNFTLLNEIPTPTPTPLFTSATTTSPAPTTTPTPTPAPPLTSPTPLIFPVFPRVLGASIEKLPSPTASHSILSPKPTSTLQQTLINSNKNQEKGDSVKTLWFFIAPLGIIIIASLSAPLLSSFLTGLTIPKKPN